MKKKTDKVSDCQHHKDRATRLSPSSEMGYWKCPDCGRQTEIEKLDD